MNKKIKLALGILVILLVLVVMGWLRYRSVHPANKKSNPVAVEVALAAKQTIPEQVHAIGTLRAEQIVNMSLQVDGYVTAVHYKSGDEVPAGAVVLQLKARKVKAALDSAKAEYKLSQITYKRDLKLLNGVGGIPLEQSDVDRTDMEKKKSAVDLAEANFEDKQLVAPFAGTLGALHLSLGDYVPAGQPLFILVNKQQLSVDYSVPALELAKLKKDQVIDVISDAEPTKHYRGHVTFISPTVDATSGTVAVEAALQNANNELSPGQYVRIVQSLGQHEAILIPEKAIVVGLNGNSTYILKQGKASLKKLSLGFRQDGFVQVLSGINVGDQVVIAGQQNLKNNAEVHVVAGIENSSPL